MSEPIGVVQAEFTAESCASASPDEVFDGGIEPAQVSPRSYNTCYKGYVVDVNSLNPEYTGSGNVLDARIAVEYADSAITNQATCEGTRVEAVFYAWDVVAGTASSGGPPEFFYGWLPIEQQQSYGTWIAVFGGICQLGVDLTDMIPGASYRVAATARTPGNSTRKVRIGTYRPINIQ